MQHPTTASGNLRAGPARKRAVLRALRHFYLWGWVRYHGQLIQQESHLAAFFPKESVAAVKAILGTGRKWWYQQDPLLPFRRNDGQVHLPQRSSATPAACTQGLTLRMLTYNCRTLGYTQARLVEIAEDLHVRGIHVAALQCTCWKQDQVRHEWIVKGRHGQQLFHCISWRRDPSNVQTGVLLLLSCAVFDKAHIIWRLDPGHSAEGRFGGVRVVDRKSRQPHDHTFITAYAPQETAADEEKQVFFTQLQQTLHGLPARTRVWLLGDFNAHIGHDLCSPSVGTFEPEASNDNGFNIAHLCAATGLALANTFHNAGSTWWSPDGNTSHRLDYIAIPIAFRRRVAHCRVNKNFGQRWQTAAVRDHWPLEVHARLPQQWPAKRQNSNTISWNAHALGRASRDPLVAAPFLAEAQQTVAALLQEPWCNLQNLWTKCAKNLMTVSQKHFGRPRAQHNPKLLPGTFALLECRRATMHIFLEEVGMLQQMPLASQQLWRMRLVLRALQLNGRIEKARRAIKTDVKAWNQNLVRELDAALDTKDHKTAWSVSRRLAGRLYKQPRQPPMHKQICKRAWLEHFSTVQLATESAEARAVPGTLGNRSLPGPLQPMFTGEEGCRALAQAAQKMLRGKATPPGTLPVEVWSLLLQGQNDVHPGLLLMPVFELMQSAGTNFEEWCAGHGCPIPKPGGDASPNGHRVINLLDPIGKVFYKAALNLQADPPLPHQYGYSAQRSRRDAILQLTVLLERLQQERVCTSANLYDLTKAFDMLSSQSVVANLSNDLALHPTLKALLIDMQGRLQVKMPITGQAPLTVNLGTGVLQGGGTGPRLFRRVYDDAIQDWQTQTWSDSRLTCVAYEGQELDLSVAAYADDLVRVEAGRDIRRAERLTVDHTDSLKEVLQRHRLELNLRKSESLVAVRGRGAYSAAERVFAGDWAGPPLKQSVKYLGAHIQAQLSMKLEITKRIAAARNSFSLFSRFFRNSRVPQRQKIQVFHAVVNEAFLSALEVRALSESDIQRLESARGLLLRRIFGRNGFGGVRGVGGHRSVPLSLLRRLAGLAEVREELRTRRLQWLRASLAAEAGGEVRLDLAALFGKMECQADPPVNAHGQLTAAAPSFLRLLAADLRAVVPDWNGFVLGWKDVFLAFPKSKLRSRLPLQENQRLEPPQAQPMRSLSALPPRGSPLEIAASLCILTDGTCPETLDSVSAEDWISGVYCGQCAAGPWHGKKSFFQHIVRKHAVRNVLNSKTCPLCAELSLKFQHVEDMSRISPAEQL